jgi:hypothetical protein
MKPAPRPLLCGKSASVGRDTGHEELSKVGHELTNKRTSLRLLLQRDSLTTGDLAVSRPAHRWLFTDF